MSKHAEADKGLDLSGNEPLSTEATISLFKEMMPNTAVVMSKEIGLMFPHIVVALNREVSEEQAIAGLRKKWPDAHVATIIKLFNAERKRRLERGEQIDCSPFGSQRKSKIRKNAHASKLLDAVHTGDNEVPACPQI